MSVGPVMMTVSGAAGVNERSRAVSSSSTTARLSSPTPAAASAVVTAVASSSIGAVGAPSTTSRMPGVRAILGA
jgi:hypothetical protein